VLTAKLIYNAGLRKLPLSTRLLTRFLGKTIYMVHLEGKGKWRCFKDVNKMHVWMADVTTANYQGSTVNFLVGKQ
jgi:hypothetical protein